MFKLTHNKRRQRPNRPEKPFFIDLIGKIQEADSTPGAGPGAPLTLPGPGTECLSSARENHTCKVGMLGVTCVPHAQRRGGWSASRRVRTGALCGREENAELSLDQQGKISKKQH